MFLALRSEPTSRRRVIGILVAVGLELQDKKALVEVWLFEHREELLKLTREHSESIK
jgi:hypothetical protein